ncbi:MAG: hypothetical protein NT069_23515 [Planctomycetota bacterium]|nr:hypothetical protein [Planctomycetota bacterium]
MAWSSIVVDGKIYQFYKQDFAVECAPACATMVAIMCGKGCTLTDARAYIRKIEDTWNPEAVLNPNWANDSTKEMRSISQVLSHQKIINARNRYDLSVSAWNRILRDESRPNTPSVLRVGHPYGHFIVCLGPGAAPGTVNLLDPEITGGLVNVATAGLVSYTRPDGQVNTLDRTRAVTTK